MAGSAGRRSALNRGQGLRDYWHESRLHGRKTQAERRRGIAMNGWIRIDRGGELCIAASLAFGRARPCRKARRARDRQQRLQERPQAAEGGQRRPHHGRYAEAARLHRDGGGEPDPAGVQPDLLAFDKAVEPGDTAFFFYAGHGFEIAGQNFLLPTDVPAATEGQEELVRDASDSRRPHHRAAAEQEACAPPSWCSTPAATIRSNAPAPARSPAAAGLRR